MRGDDANDAPLGMKNIAISDSELNILRFSLTDGIEAMKAERERFTDHHSKMALTKAIEERRDILVRLNRLL